MRRLCRGPRRPSCGVVPLSGWGSLRSQPAASTLALLLLCRLQFTHRVFGLPPKHFFSKHATMLQASCPPEWGEWVGVWQGRGAGWGGWGLGASRGGAMLAQPRLRRCNVPCRGCAPALLPRCLLR